MQVASFLWFAGRVAFPFLIIYGCKGKDPEWKGKGGQMDGNGKILRFYRILTDWSGMEGDSD